MKNFIKSAFYHLCKAVVFLLVGLSVIYAQERGGYAGSFLRLGLGARSAGMGGAYVGIPGSVYSAYYNPAGLPELRSQEAAFSYRRLSLDRQFYFAGIAFPIPPAAGAAFGWIHAGTDNIDGRDFNGIHTQMYSDNQNAFLFAFGIPVYRLINIGISGTIVRESLVGITAKGFGFNAGILIKPLKNLTAGASVRDIGADYSWSTESLYEHGSTQSDAFPAVYSAGTQYLIERYNTSAVLDVVKNTKGAVDYRFGCENSSLNPLVIRAGINKKNFSAGFAVTFPAFNGEGTFEYAFLSDDISPESIHIFSFTFAFTPLTQKK